MVYTRHFVRAYIKDNALGKTLVLIGNCKRSMTSERELIHKMNMWLNSKYPNWKNPIAYW